MKPAKSKTELLPSTHLRKPVFGGSHVSTSRTDPVKILSTPRQEHDTTPLTLGIEGDDGRVIVIFKRDTIIPAQTSLILPNRGKESNVKIKVVQGEYSVAAKNNLVVEIVINDVLPSSGGDPQVEVTFDIDANAILHFSAKDGGTGNPQKVNIKGTGAGLSKNDIERHLNEVERDKRK